MKTQPHTYRMTTLGCRANHAEEREMEAVLHARGFRAAEQEETAHLEVVHTCSVTSRAAAKSRQAIRRAARKRGGHLRPPKVVVTGCYVGTDQQTAGRLASGEGAQPGTTLGHADEQSLTMIQRFALEIDEWLGISPEPTPSPVCKPLHALPIIELPTRPARHARAEIRIQDGCDAHCTFCIIPTLRPTLRSKSLGDVESEARRLVDLGHKEIVLTGIFIGAYGHSTALRRRQAPSPSARLSDLVDALAHLDGVERLRISSMEPMDVTEDLLDAMLANRRVVVPHLHLPLQSGSDNILRRMNRQYRVGEYLEMIQRVQSALGTDGLPPAITTDIICGFPGETPEDFKATCKVAQQVGYLHMHVFPFSPRAGTAAARWKDRFVDPVEIRDRVQALIDLENEPENGLAVRFRKQLVGRRLRAIVEQPDRERPGRWTGRCDHYELLSMTGPAFRGQMVDVVVDRLDGSCTLATIMEEPVSLPILFDNSKPLETCP
ncbi:MAG: MiaB/RimO family radical SAM methylthiotransferase [Phycisphaerales bacterium]|nr:MiaB/RimO family radical SAM methylthiotransferase [Phycisphaerales bacterium]